MGSSQSSSKNNSRSNGITPEDKRQLMREHGVLIPPSFGIGNDFFLPPSTLQRIGGGFGILDEKTRWVPPPGMSFLQYIQQARLPSERILRDNMTPGLWLLATASHESAVLASCSAPENGKPMQGMLTVSSKTTPFGRMELRATTSGLPVLAANMNSIPGLTVQGDARMGGESLGLGCHMNLTKVFGQYGKTKSNSQSEYYRNDPFVSDDGDQEQEQAKKPNIHVGSWIRSRASPDFRVDGVNGYAALELPNGGIAAVEGYLPLASDYSTMPNYSYLLAMDLNAATNDNTSDEDTQGPPLVVTLKQTPDVLSIDLSQVVVFDRDVVNLLETRCPKIRNRLSWTVQMQKPLAAGASSVSDGSSSIADKDSLDPTLNFGLAWQLNRGLCLKMNASTVPSTDSRPTLLTGAVLFKRWKQPRVTCSILFGTSNTSFYGFQGIGLELETGADNAMGGSSEDLYADKPQYQVSSATPETKVTLPYRT